MGKIQKTGISAVVLAFSVALLSWQSGTYPQYCNQIEANKENCPGYNLLPFFFFKLTDFFHSYESTFIVLGTIALAWFTLELRRSTDKLWLAGESQIAITKIAAKAAKKSADTLVATERPRLFIVVQLSNLQEMISNISQTRGPADSKANMDLKVSYFFENYGRTPAIIKESSHYLIHRTKLPKKWTYFPLGTIEIEPAIRATESTNARECPLDHLAPFTKQHVDEIMRGHRSLWFFGRVVYDDLIGGNDHEHRFLWRYHGGSRGFRPCYDYPYYIKNT